MVGSIYEADHLMLLPTEYLSSRSYGFGEEDFLFFSIKSLWELMIGRIFVGDHFMLLHT